MSSASLPPRAACGSSLALPSPPRLPEGGRAGDRACRPLRFLLAPRAARRWRFPRRPGSRGDRGPLSLRCDVLAIGTELLLGQIVDTNPAWIGEQLAANGIDCLFQAKVGDNHARIVDGLRASLSRADAVLVCGGLGPTHDDTTREAITEVMGSELVVDDAVADVIRHL